MSTSGPGSSDYAALVQRAHVLGLQIWTRDETGGIVSLAPHTGPVPWTDAKCVRVLIEGIAHPIDAEGIELAPGFRAWSISDPEQSATSDGRIVTHLYEDAPLLDVIAAELGHRPCLMNVLANEREVAMARRALRWVEDDRAELVVRDHAVKGLRRELAGSYEQLAALYRIGRTLNALDEPRQFVEATTDQLSYILDFEWLAVQYVDSVMHVERLDESLVLRGELPCAIDDFSAVTRAEIDKWTADQWTTLLRPGQNPIATLVDAEVLIEPIFHDEIIIGALVAGSKQGHDNEVSSIDMQLLDAVADFLGVFHQNVSRFETQRRLFEGTVRALSSAIDAKDPYTRGHSERVALLGRQLALAAGLSEEQADRVHLAGQLHDIGKIGVSEATLRKPAALTDAEKAEIQRHPVIGYDILRDVPQMADLLPGVLYHHERIDGLGYPHRLDGDRIPIFGRLLAVVDAFDAMSSTRAYRAQMPRAHVLEELRKGAGTQWDAGFVEKFLSLDLASYDAMIAGHRRQDAAA